ncbi:MAG: hypothetical protein HOP28_12995 [Gemmatimonadales bacterium]|nr:hypothetical protein [Gemmatimonadales bacterium]
MIVRTQPTPRGRLPAPITVRERFYLTHAWGLYSEKHLRRKSGLGYTRLHLIADALGLPPYAQLPRLTVPEPTPGPTMPATMIRRCQACRQLMLCPHCRCGWEAAV